MIFSKGDCIVCMDTSGPSSLEVEVGKEYVVEEVLHQCYMKLLGIKQSQKMWRFKLKGENSD